MAFDPAVYFPVAAGFPNGVGIYTASSIEKVPPPAQVNADGSVTLTALNGPGDVQDQNNGFPSTMTFPDNPLGIPGSFLPVDTAGYQFKFITAMGTFDNDNTVPAYNLPDIISAYIYNGDGSINPSFNTFYVAGYNSAGFLLGHISNNGTTLSGNFIGSPDGTYLFVTPGTSLDIYANAAGDPTNVTIDVLKGNTTFYPVADNVIPGTNTPIIPPNGPDTPLGTPIPCFAAGTHLSTPNGHACVEDLRPGDLVATLSGAHREIAWRGSRTVDCARHPKPRDVWPVRIAAGAFGAAPTRALVLSPDHAMFAEGVLIPVKHLVNGTTIRQTPVDHVIYHHIELATHDVVLAEGLPAETYLDTGSRTAFEGGPVVQAHADFATRRWEAEGYAPLMVFGPEVDAVRARVEAIAGALLARAA